MSVLPHYISLFTVNSDYITDERRNYALHVSVLVRLSDSSAYLQILFHTHHNVCFCTFLGGILTYSHNQVRDSDPRDPKRETIVHLIDDFRIAGANGDRILFRTCTPQKTMYPNGVNQDP